jgi:hypothetical protein
MKIRRMRIACWINEVLHTHTHKQYVYSFLLFHSNYCYMNAPQFYVIRTLPILFNLTIRQRNNFVICKYFFLNFLYFSIIFIFDFFYFFEASFYNTD